jgi:hypothetical protein
MYESSADSGKKRITHSYVPFSNPRLIEYRFSVGGTLVCQRKQNLSGNTNLACRRLVARKKKIALGGNL